ncbi:MAG: alpha/beta hydrolase [Proteobacteria bacterium]|nr:alpha/beta hydrolase [Pseudomonadota bacterium]
MKKIILKLLLLIILFVIALPFYYNTEKETLSAEIRSKTDGEFITLSQGITHYQQANVGADRTVVLVHGFSVPFYIWDPTFEFLAKQGFHVIRYDLFGRGYSDRPDVDYNQEFFDRQLMDLIEALGAEKKVDIVGLSMGGAIVAKFVADHPEKINKAVFVDPSHEGSSSKLLSFPLSIPLLGEYYATVFMLPKAAESQLGDFRYPEKFASWPERYRQQMHFKGFRNAILSTLRHFMPSDKIHHYEKVGESGIPALLIWGRDDQTLPLANSPRVAKALNVEVFVVEDSGHLPHFERPEIVNPELLRFLNL